LHWFEQNIRCAISSNAFLQIGSGAEDCASTPSHTTGRAVFRIQRLNAAAFSQGRRKV
jgi:hypothetical protein